MLNLNEEVGVPKSKSLRRRAPGAWPWRLAWRTLIRARPHGTTTSYRVTLGTAARHRVADTDTWRR
eukprot:3060291-Prymnesium_polylepis.1